jgi:FKBP-type peptidyl-prolyl cis-trans isomerase
VTARDQQNDGKLFGEKSMRTFTVAPILLAISASSLFAQAPAKVNPVPCAANFASSTGGFPSATSGSEKTPDCIRSPTGLAYQVIKKGNGRIARPGDQVIIHEVTTLTNGRLVYSSRSGKPVGFLLGGKQVIAGVDEGVTGMRVGERRKLVVPPSLAVRMNYPANTPRDSTLIIDIELVAIGR